MYVSRMFDTVIKTAGNIADAIRSATSSFNDSLATTVCRNLIAFFNKLADDGADTDEFIR